ncbi:HpaII family restriction endonuclease [Candidatus Saccharibacteria bacterium]|nr:HpaII family restriction endonuclease [Candidatus Saccharibacteria bacterium]
MKTYNKGEWSELYAICKMLYDQKVDVCDKDLKPTNQKIRILKLLMHSILGDSEYTVDGKDNGDIAILYNGRLVKSANLSKELILSILNEIVTGSGASFNVPSGESAMEELMLDDFKATSYKKSDVETYSIMPHEKLARQVGFSVKSKIGSPATLLNASESTNFIYKVEGFTGDIDEVNAIATSSKIKDRMQYIFEHNGEFVFYGMTNQTFQQNLEMTDSNLPEIISGLLMVFFVGKGTRTVKDLIDAYTNFFNDKSPELVSKKVKDFLSNITLGMIPTREWDGSGLGGGCIFVKDDGSLACFTLYDMDEFKDYLINNTKFETASTSKHKFGTLYKQGNKLFFNLNLDIRFIH